MASVWTKYTEFEKIILKMTEKKQSAKVLSAKCCLKGTQLNCLSMPACILCFQSRLAIMWV